jgi:hypothetical protein
LLNLNFFHKYSAQLTRITLNAKKTVIMKLYLLVKENQTSLIQKKKRSVPLRLKNPDPNHCLDIIDDMYSIYYELEVIIIQVFYFLYNIIVF